MTALLSILPDWFKSAFSTATWALGTLIFISAIASWIPEIRRSKLGALLEALTEPIVAPVRRVLRRFPALDSLPIDFSPLVTFFLLSFLGELIWRF